jgi:predicted Zn-dependent protease
MSAHVPASFSYAINSLQVRSGDRYISCTASEKELAAVLEHGDSALGQRHSIKKPRRYEDNAILINKFYTEDMEMCR